MRISFFFSFHSLRTIRNFSKDISMEVILTIVENTPIIILFFVMCGLKMIFPWILYILRFLENFPLRIFEV